MRCRRRRFRLLLHIGIFLFPGWVNAVAAAKPKLVLASTTSTLDSGLFDVLMPAFEKKYNCEVKVIAVGTGQAIRIAKDGNADVLLVHDRASEDKFVAAGYGLKRLDVMHNDFIVVGPKTDSLGLKGLKAKDSFKKLAENHAVFISRGDDSGTNKKELTIWAQLRIKPCGDWYVESGTGMEAALRIANEKVAYTLCDRATWLSHKKESDALDMLVEGDPELFNPYSVIIVSPAKFPRTKYELAKKFADFIRGREGQNIIKNYGIDKFGVPLFFPDVIK